MNTSELNATSAPVLSRRVNFRQGETLFIFPFNHQSELPQDKFNRLKNRLNSLSDRTLLFLHHIEEISWNIENSSSGTYGRQTQPIAPCCRRTNIIRKDGLQNAYLPL